MALAEGARERPSVPGCVPLAEMLDDGQREGRHAGLLVDGCIGEAACADARAEDDQALRSGQGKIPLNGMVHPCKPALAGDATRQRVSERADVNQLGQRTAAHQSLSAVRADSRSATSQLGVGRAAVVPYHRWTRADRHVRC